MTDSTVRFEAQKSIQNWLHLESMVSKIWLDSLKNFEKGREKSAYSLLNHKIDLSLLTIPSFIASLHFHNK